MAHAGAAVSHQFLGCHSAPDRNTGRDALSRRLRELRDAAGLRQVDTAQHDERAVIAGTTSATALLTERGDVDAYVELFRALEQLTVFDDEARALLVGVADRYRAMA